MGDDNYFDGPPRVSVPAGPWPEEPAPAGSEQEYGNVVRLSAPRDPAVERGRKLPLVWFLDIEPVLDTSDFVQGLLMERGSVVVYGVSNSGKTFWVTDLCLHVCAQMPWNNRRVEMGGVVYCALEGTLGFRNRVAAWKEAHGVEGHDLPFAAVPVGLNLRDPTGADLDGLVRAVGEARDRMKLPVRLIVIDTLSRALAGGNENSPEDMGALVRCMDRLREESEAAVLFVHHSGKDQAKGARGHSLLQAAIDTEIEVVANETGGGSVATVVKQREMRKGDAFPFTLKVVELGQNRHGEPVTTCVVEHGVPDGNASRPRTRLTGHNLRAMEILNDLLVSTGDAGHSGVPTGHLSVPEKWWRDRFYDRAMPGGEDEAKRKAFRRASDFLVEKGFVGMANKRIWQVSARADSATFHTDNEGH